MQTVRWYYALAYCLLNGALSISAYTVSNCSKMKIKFIEKCEIRKMDMF